MKHLLFAFSALCLLICAHPDRAAAYGPTENRFHLGAGLAFGDPFDGDFRPQPWGYGLALRTGFTFGNGLYIGAMADLYIGNESKYLNSAARAQMFGGVLGGDLKLSQTVSARVAVMGGLHIVEANNTSSKPMPESGNPFVAPSIEIIMGMGDHLYLSPGARFNVFVLDDFETAVTWSLSLGATL